MLRVYPFSVADNIESPIGKKRKIRQVGKERELFFNDDELFGETKPLKFYKQRLAHLFFWGSSYARLSKRVEEISFQLRSLHSAGLFVGRST